LTDPDCISLRDRLLNSLTFDEIASDALEKLLVHLRESSTEAIARREYEHANDSKRLSDSIRCELISREKADDRSAEQKHEYEVSRNEAEQRFLDELAEFDRIWSGKKSRFLERQQAERDSFEEQWTVVYPQRFRKQSGRLLELQDIERKLGFIASFDEAAVVRGEADLLEQRELAAAQESLIEAYSAAQAKMEREQASKQELFESKRIDRRSAIVAHQQTEREYLANRETVLNGKPHSHKRESSFDIITRPQPSAGATAKIHYDSAQRTKGRMLPPLLAPNDPRVKQMCEKKRSEQQQRTRRFLNERERRAREKAEPWVPRAATSVRPQNRRGPRADGVVPEAFRGIVERVAIPEDCPTDEVMAVGTETFSLTQATEYQE
jgi:hypothetical protein